MEKNEYMDIKRLINIILSKKIFIILILMLSIVLGYFYSYYYKKPQYNSSVTILLTGDTTQGEKEVTQTDLNLNSGLISTYSNIAKSSNVVKQVIDNLQLNLSVQELQKNITVTKIDNTQFIKITVKNDSAQMAMEIANETSKVFSKQIKEIYNIENINIVDVAELENEPCNINHSKDIIIFAILGVVLSGIYVSIVYIFDDTIKTEKDIQSNLKLENIGSLPNISKEEDGLIIENNPKSYVVECLKTIRTNILYATNITKKKAILITSAKEKEGKSYFANNIAVAFAQANKKVILVNTNLRSLADKNEAFGIKDGEGLSDFLKEISDDKLENLMNSSKYIQETKIPNLHVLTNGTIPPNPSELISSNNMKNLIELLKSMYDIVLFDGTPCMLVSDSIALSSMVDTTILVVENRKTKINELKKTKKQIEDVKGKILGVILNKTEVQKNKYYGKGYGYYYGEITEENKAEIIKQDIITVEQIIENAKPKIEKELLNKKVEKEIEAEKIEETQKQEDNSISENKFKSVIRKIFNRIINIENRLNKDDSKERINSIFEEIGNIKNEQIQNKREILTNIDELKNEKQTIIEKIDKLNQNQNNLSERQENDKKELLENINELRDETKLIQNDIENLQINNGSMLDSINTLEAEKENILLQISALKDNNSEMFENISELTYNKDFVTSKIEDFDEKIEKLKNEQLKAKEDIENTVKEIQTIEILKQRTQNLENEFNVLAELKVKIEAANREIELLRQLQNEQINNIDYKISNLKELQLNNSKELLEKIAAINYDDKLLEINENILKSKDEYTKIINEMNKNKQAERASNIISFESLKANKKKKANKKVFSINENIMYEDLENLSTCVVDINDDTFNIMVN